MSTIITVDSQRSSPSNSASRSNSSDRSEDFTDDEASSDESWQGVYSDEIEPSDSASRPASRPRTGTRYRTSESRPPPSSRAPTRRHTTTERSRRASTRIHRHPVPATPSSTDTEDDYPGYGRGITAPVPNDFSKITHKFGGIRLSKFRQGDSQTDSFSSLSSTISRDNTTGERARNAKLLAEFAKKCRNETLAPKRESRVEHVRAEEARAAKVRAQRAQIKEAPMDPRWRDHTDFAGAYMQAARRKVAVEVEDDRHHPHPGMRRTETFSAQLPPAYNVRYATVPPQPQYSDDDTARRSSGYKDPRRSSDTPPSSKREKLRRRSPEHTTRDPYINIVEPPSPSTARTPKKPSLQWYSSAPPTLSQTRKEPSRSRTTDNYATPRKDTVPPLPRSQTFTNDRRDPGRGRERGGSRLKKEYTETESDSDNSPTYQTRPSHSPRRAPEPTVYRVVEGRAHPTTYDTSNVSYANYPGANLYDTARRPSDQRDYYPHRGRGDPVYA